MANKGKIAVGFQFSPKTVDRMAKLTQHLECNRTSLVERLIRVAAESLDRKMSGMAQEGVVVQEKFTIPESIDFDAIR